MYWGWVPVLETVCFTIEENKSIQSLTLFKKWNKNLLSIGSQDSQNSSHQIQYSHLYKKLVVWHFCKTIQTDIASENFIEKLHY
jgi:hypothetical protein